MLGAFSALPLAILGAMLRSKSRAVESKTIFNI